MLCVNDAPKKTSDFFPLGCAYTTELEARAKMLPLDMLLFYFALLPFYEHNRMALDYGQ